jgi:uncharacterized RmlC-like cupin family protein
MEGRGFQEMSSVATAPIQRITPQQTTEFGLGGTDSCVGSRGDLFFIPKGGVHRESNPGSDESVALVVRLGRGESVFNVHEPAST